MYRKTLANHKATKSPENRTFRVGDVKGSRNFLSRLIGFDTVFESKAALSDCDWSLHIKQSNLTWSTRFVPGDIGSRAYMQDKVT